jgi:hypothetical protein
LIEKGYLDTLFESAYKILLDYRTTDGQTRTVETSQKKIQLGNYPGYEYNAGCGPYKFAPARAEDTPALHRKF